MGIQGQENLGELTDVLKEVASQSKDDSKQGNKDVMTDEIEEKQVALEMLGVFIDEAPEACFDSVDQMSQLLLSLTTYEANCTIRMSSAGCLPGLVKVVKTRSDVQVA